MPEMSSVYLGFAKPLQKDKLFSLQRQYLPLGKIGGFPAWLNPVNLPLTEHLECLVCRKPLVFLLQIYCTSPSSPSHAFHRYLFVFVCRDPECSKTNDASNFSVFRCQLSRNNPFYNYENSLDPWRVGNIPDPFYNASTFAKLCKVCGCRATKKCAKCTQQWYCSRVHQILDWTFGGHKQSCGLTCPQLENCSLKNVSNRCDFKEIDTLKEDNVAENALLFKEFLIEMDTENNDVNDEFMDEDKKEETDDEDDNNKHEIFDEKELSIRIKELKKFENSDCEISSKDLEGIEEAPKDDLYKKFYQILFVNPKQILRYEKGGQPLLATDYSPKPELREFSSAENEFAAEKCLIPKCEFCGASRQFELQLMPHLLSLIDVDKLGKSIDWATLMIFTCSRDCQISEDGYAREFILKQDFVESTRDEEFNSMKKKKN